MTDCAHTWPDELTSDAPCLAGCGLVYGEWNKEDDPDE